MGGYRTIYPQYGISEDAQKLTVIDEFGNKWVVSFVDSNGTCINVLKESTVYWPMVLCKYVNDDVSTLNPISNLSVTQNDLGAYGENAQLGNDQIIGSWGYVPIDGGSGETLIFDENGTGVKEFYQIAVIGRPFTYGISEDGLRLTLDLQGETENYQITGLFEGCYHAIKNDIDYKLCKLD